MTRTSKPGRRASSPLVELAECRARLDELERLGSSNEGLERSRLELEAAVARVVENLKLVGNDAPALVRKLLEKPRRTP